MPYANFIMGCSCSNNCSYICSLLPPQFPQEKPVISVFPPVRHHLVDKQGVYVTGPLISNVCINCSFNYVWC